MVFSSSIFLAWFLPIFLLLYHLADRRYKNLLLLIGSVFFYAWGAPAFIFVFFATTFVDFHLVNFMHEAPTLRRKKLFLILSLSLNLGLLAYIKYANFFVENMNAFLHGLGMQEVAWTEIVLPLGISFFVFESLTYVIDVYRGLHAPLKKFWDYQMYILLFPKLIAGPIIRYHEIADQINYREETTELFLTGFYRFVIGLAKKVLIANKVGAAIAIYFNANPADLTTTQAWIGILGYTIQIYYDFSGYSDMALGLGRMLGFRFPENFNNPFISTSITEFWRRWHISLGNWMRNYLYIPLGGNRTDRPWLVYRNLTIVFLVSGLWHGASWNFVLWGAVHGLFLILDRLFLLKILKKVGRVPAILFTSFVVMIAFGLFKIEDLGQAKAYYGLLIGIQPPPATLPVPVTLYPDLEFWITFGLGWFFAWFAAFPFLERIQKVAYSEMQPLTRHSSFLTLSILFFIFSLSFLIWAPFNPFLYFKF